VPALLGISLADSGVTRIWSAVIAWVKGLSLLPARSHMLNSNGDGLHIREGKRTGFASHRAPEVVPATLPHPRNVPAILTSL
jgi:hypothetical protein